MNWCKGKKTLKRLHKFKEIETMTPLVDPYLTVIIFK